MGKAGERRQLAPVVPAGSGETLVLVSRFANYSERSGYNVAGRIREALEEEFAFIRQLIELRHQKGLTQAELAEQVGTRQPSISRLEHGQLGSFEFLRRVAEALDAQVEIHLTSKHHSS